MVNMLRLALAVILAALGTRADANNVCRIHDAAENAINLVDDCGAANDGRTDIGRALQSAIGLARATHRSVFIPGGTYLYGADPNHHDIVVNSVTVAGDPRNPALMRYEAAKDPLVKTNAAGEIDPSSVRSAIILKGDRPILKNISISVNRAGITCMRRVFRPPNLLPADPCRAVSPWAAGVYVMPDTTRFIIASVQVSGPFTVGIMVRSGHGGLIKNNVVSDTLADGISINNQSDRQSPGNTSYDIEIAGNQVSNTGDDMIGLASVHRLYSPDKSRIVQVRTSPLRNLYIHDNYLHDNKWGAGIGLWGGRNIRIIHNTIANTSWPGIGLKANREPIMDHPEISDILIENNSISGAAQWDDAQADRCPDKACASRPAGISVMAAPAAGGVRFQVERVTIQGNAIQDTANGYPAVSLFNASDVRLERNRIRMPGPGKAIVTKRSTRVAADSSDVFK